MKLYYAQGTCSLAPHIVAHEAGLKLELVRVDLSRAPHVTEHGRDFTEINRNGYVPVLELDDGEMLTEGTVIVQYLADLAPATKLAPPAGTLERYRLQEWLNFVSSELHKMFSPWLFHPEYGPRAEEVARKRITARLEYVDGHLAAARYLLGDRFTVADAYAYTIIGWSRVKHVDLSGLENVTRYLREIDARPSVREALRAERASASRARQVPA
jgi:glutathione S-transferase